MERGFEESLCLGTGIAFVFLTILISVPNSIMLIAFYKNPLRCFRKAFSVFLVFIAAMDLFNGIVVCFGEAVMRFLCALDNKNVPRDGDIIKILGYIGINSSILLVTAMSIDRFVSVVCPHFYLCKVKKRNLVFCNTAIVVFSSVFSLLQLVEQVSMDVYLTADIHLHTTFPLVTTALAYLGIFFVLKKRARIDFERQTKIPSNPTLHDKRRIKVAHMERKFATTSLFILLFLITSLIPYFTAIIIEVNCTNCGNKNWFLALRESCVVFLFLNSAVNPFLTTLRINELKKSVKIVLHLEHQDNIMKADFRLPTGSQGNNGVSD